MSAANDANSANNDNSADRANSVNFWGVWRIGENSVISCANSVKEGQEC